MATEYLNNKNFEKIICRFQDAKKERSKYELIVEDIRATAVRTAKRNKFQMPDSWTVTQVAYEVVLAKFEDAQKDLATAFYTLSENIVRYAKFNLIDQDDAVQEGVMICFEKIDRFDPTKGKAFNYMTTCILNHFRQLYRTARNYNELKKKYHDFMQSQIDQSNRQPYKGGKNDKNPHRS